MTKKKTQVETAPKAEIAPKAPKAPKVEKAPKAPKAEKIPGVRGRKVDPTSARQSRLARFAAVEAAGGEVKRGRPKSTEPKAPKVKKEKAIKPEETVEAAVEIQSMEIEHIDQ